MSWLDNLESKTNQTTSIDYSNGAKEFWHDGKLCVVVYDSGDIVSFYQGEDMKYHVVQIIHDDGKIFPYF